ncbi:MAG TPA: ASPIC/UnbV domain-containing protein, partial [Blastocatellia bacterium]|nr:ASPIC/UnbV domain-containing protein [Blastocatellia bacterium]
SAICCLRLRISREVTSGGSFGASPLTQQIGLGNLKAAKIDAVEIQWPASKTKQTFRDVPANQFIEVQEAATDIKPLSRRAFSLIKPATPAKPRAHH